MCRSCRCTKLHLIISIAILSLVFLLLLVFIVIFPTIVKKGIENVMIFTPGSHIHKMFESRITTTFLHVHVFNCTNTGDVRKGAKPNFKEIGPFVYEKIMRRQNFTFKSDTVEFESKATYHFRRDLSYANESDVQFTSINLVNAISQSSGGFLQAWSLITFSQTFVTTTVKEIMWGYRDFRSPVPIGLMYHLNGKVSKRVRIKAGVSDPKTFGKIVAVGGETSMNVWSSDEANQFKGVEPPFSARGVTLDSPITLEVSPLCRSFKLTPYKEIRSQLDNRIPLLEFRLNLAQKENPELNEKEGKYCPKNRLAHGCPPIGLIPIYPCLDLMIKPPIYISHPYFYGTHRSIRERFTGLRAPGANKDATVIRIEPNTGIGMDFAIRTQLNVYVNNIGYNSSTKKYTGSFYFPIVRLEEIGMAEQSDLDLIYSYIILPQQLVNILVSTILCLIGCIIALLVTLLVRLRLSSTDSDEDPKLEESTWSSTYVEETKNSEKNQNQLNT